MRNQVQYHSEPVQEILGAIPSWITRWGILLIFSFVLLLLLGGCLIRYPETVSGTITMTSDNPPSSLIAQQSGILDTLLVKNDSFVRKGEVLAVLSSTANTNDILRIGDLIERNLTLTTDYAAVGDVFYNNLQLGDIQPQWAELTLIVKESCDYINMNNTEQWWSISRRFEHALAKLKVAYADWKKDYAFIAPEDGTFSISEPCAVGQYVNAGETIACVVPSGKNDCVGRAKINSSGIGKVNPGQTVNVMLSGFPYLDYGIIKGIVSNIITVPEIGHDGNIYYVVEIEFPNGLVTTYEKTIPIIQGIDGVAEIITKDRSLIMSLIAPLGT